MVPLSDGRHRSRRRVGLLVPVLAGYAAALLSGVMVGAIIAHATRWPGSVIPAMTLLALCALVVWYRLFKTGGLKRALSGVAR